MAAGSQVTVEPKNFSPRRGGCFQGFFLSQVLARKLKQLRERGLLGLKELCHSHDLCEDCIWSFVPPDCLPVISQDRLVFNWVVGSSAVGFTEQFKLD